MRPVVLTAGEPAGVGPDIVLAAASREWPVNLVCVADRALLATRAQALGIDIELREFESFQKTTVHQPGTLDVIDIPLNAAVQPGVLDPANASYVLATLDCAIELCRSGDTHAMVTAPIQKSVINEAGIPFQGHTEFIADAFNIPRVVMMLVAETLRVALATTHLPLSEVTKAITQESLSQTLDILHRGLQQIGIPNPRLAVLGLNPHAGESGYLGREELDIIAPVCDRLRATGMALQGPISADTAFTDAQRSSVDAYLAMYHDQGLPVLKTVGFGEAVNVTLGLPIVRTSVDHGTALSLAGTGRANASSLMKAITLALSMNIS